MSPGFEKPPQRESEPSNVEVEELFNNLNGCSLEDPSDEIDTQWSVQLCEKLRDKCIKEAKADAGESAGPEKVKVETAKVLQKNIKIAKERNMDAEPGSVEEKISYLILQVLGEKEEELFPSKSGPKNMQLHSDKQKPNKSMPTK